MKDNKSIPIKKDILEIVKSEYLNNNYKIEFPYIVYRIDNKGMRLYASYVDEELIYGPSITTVIDRMQSNISNLDRWKIENFKTYEDYKIEMEKRAVYGTFLHIIFSKLLQGYTLNSLNYKNQIQVEFEKEDIYLRNKELKYYANKFKKDVLAFLCWIKEYEIEPISIEQSLLNYIQKEDESFMPYGGCIDLVCKARLEEEKELIIVDFKSGESGFYESHQIQLEACKQMWNELYPDYQVERIFNLGMNDGKIENFYKYYTEGIYRNFKPYKFKEHTENILWKWTYYLTGFYNIYVPIRIENQYEYNDDIEIGIDTDITELITQFNPLDFMEDNDEEEVF